MPGGILGRLVVNFVVLLISFIAYSSQIFVIWPWYGRVLSVELIVLLLPFNILVGLLFWNYFLTVTTDPGRVPDNWKPDTNAEGYEVKKLTGGPRYCRYCERPKPPRTHHCRQCGTCVLRMDHHCPWVNNCVGHFNHGHFIRFLFFVDLACSYHLAMVWRRLYVSLGTRYWHEEPDTTEMIFMILNMITCIPVLVCVGIFSLYHFNAILKNTTTIERWEKDKVATMVRRGRVQQVKFPYNIGRRRNIESVLGKNPYLWCWPTKAPGSGLKYEITSNDDPISEEEDYPTRDDESKRFELPDSPWTFENGSVNPNLQPSNSARRRAAKQQQHGASSLPPYHPDYVPPAPGGSYTYADDDDEDEDDYEGDPSRVRVRRGSEGYEVRPANREDMLARYLSEMGGKRYNYYVPEPASGSEDEGEEEEDQYGEDAPQDVVL